ncbi:MAG: Gfo/Idh/MocA family protein [Sphaerochaetaceae bacterium]
MFKVGIIGLGIISKSHFAAYELINMADIVAVCDLNVGQREQEFSAKGIRCYTDYRKMIDTEQLDMVDICLPTFLHKDVAVYALAHNINTLVEKPMAVDMNQVQEMKRAEELSSARLMVAHVSRFKPQSMFLRRILDSGELGKPKFFHTWRFSSNPAKRYDDWLLDYSRGGGTIFDFQVHDIDLACWYLGEPIEFHSKKVAGNQENELGSFISELGFGNDVSALLEISHVMPDKYSFTSGMSMLFEKGEIETSFSSDTEGWFNITTADSIKKYRYSELPVTFCRNPYGEEIAHFIDCIKTSKPFLISSEESGKAVYASRKLVENSR